LCAVQVFAELLRGEVFEAPGAVEFITDHQVRRASSSITEEAFFFGWGKLNRAHEFILSLRCGIRQAISVMIAMNFYGVQLRSSLQMREVQIFLGKAGSWPSGSVPEVQAAELGRSAVEARPQT
jgi:hypothetical protein